MPDPDHFSFTDFVDFQRGLSQDIQSRHSLRPVLVYGIGESDNWDEFMEWESAKPGETPPSIDRRAAALLADDEDAEELEVYAELTGIGIGAEGYAIALAVGAGAVYLAGAANDLVDVAHRLKRLWERLRKRHGPPVLSLGAVVHLVVMDLYEQLGNLDQVVVVSATDVSSMDPGAGYSGQAVYSVILARGEDVWVYLIEDRGQVIHFGKGRQRRTGQLSLLSGEMVYGEASKEPVRVLFTMNEGNVDGVGGSATSEGS